MVSTSKTKGHVVVCGYRRQYSHIQKHWAVEGKRGKHAGGRSVNRTRIYGEMCTCGNSFSNLSTVNRNFEIQFDHICKLYVHFSLFPVASFSIAVKSLKVNNKKNISVTV